MDIDQVTKKIAHFEKTMAARATELAGVSKDYIPEKIASLKNGILKKYSEGDTDLNALRRGLMADLAEVQTARSNATNADIALFTVAWQRADELTQPKMALLALAMSADVNVLNKILDVASSCPAAVALLGPIVKDREDGFEREDNRVLASKIEGMKAKFIDCREAAILCGIETRLLETELAAMEALDDASTAQKMTVGREKLDAQAAFDRFNALREGGNAQ
ncbi:MAG: hypothetical protein KKE73_06190 [Proteobacteria bacterium]|nr:hypothetical protein [Pseudomonadota bacterium]